MRAGQGTRRLCHKPNGREALPACNPGVGSGAAENLLNPLGRSYRSRSAAGSDSEARLESATDSLPGSKASEGEAK